MRIADLETIQGRNFAAGRTSKPIVGTGRAIECDNFCMGVVELDPNGGQTPWHNHPNEEIYLILEGEVEMALGDELATLHRGQTVHIEPGVFHQITNLTPKPAKFLYVYAPAGDVLHWKQELEGTLPRAGVDAPPLPKGAADQRTQHG